MLLVVLIGAVLGTGWLLWPRVLADQSFATMIDSLRRNTALNPSELAPTFEDLYRVGPDEIRRLLRTHLDSSDAMERAAALHLLGSWYLIDGYPDLQDPRVEMTRRVIAPVAGIETRAGVGQENSANIPDPRFDPVQEFEPAILRSLRAKSPVERSAAIAATLCISDLKNALDLLVSICREDADPELRAQTERVLRARDLTPDGQPSPYLDRRRP